MQAIKSRCTYKQGSRHVYTRILFLSEQKVPTILNGGLVATSFPGLDRKLLVVSLPIPFCLVSVYAV